MSVSEKLEMNDKSDGIESGRTGGFVLTQECIDNYLRSKVDQGVSPTVVGKYRTPLIQLLQWAGESTELTPEKMKAWRENMVKHGYGKTSIQNYVTVINSFMRTIGHPDLGIPKPPRNDLTGRRFGYLTAIEPTENRHHRYISWLCQCRCGKEIEVSSSMLIRGCTTSCGCLNVEILQHHNRYEEGTELRQALEEKVLNPNSQSGYVGVQPKRDKWIASITYKKKLYRLGTFSNIEDAVKARARAKEAVMEDAARIYEETAHLYGDSPRRPPRPVVIPAAPPEPIAIRARRSNNTSGQAGVTRNQGKWTASISVQKFRYRLGVYEELEDAITVRKRAEELVKNGDLEQLKAICTNWRK